MILKPKYCYDIGCPLANHGQGFSQPEGLGTSKVLVLAEALGYNEEQEGLPLRPNAVAGSLFHRVLQRARISRDELVIYNVVNCKPINNLLDGQSYEVEAIETCRHYVDAVVKKFKPKVILTLGNVALRALTGMMGHKKTISDLRGYVFENKRGYTYIDEGGMEKPILVVPSLHPSYIKRGNLHLTSLLMIDLLKAYYIAQGKNIPYIIDPRLDDSLDYILYPTTEQIKDLYEQCKADPSIFIALDVENPKSADIDEEEREMENQTITQIQFSIKRNSGIAIKWNQDTYDIIKKICLLSNPKVNHNLWQYDRKVLKNHGISLAGEQYDTQWMANHHQADLPIGLQAVGSWFNFPFAWKHLNGSDFELYGIADSDCALQLYYNLKDALEKRHLWGEYNIDHNRYTGYYGLVQGLEPILVDISNRGLPINESRQQKFGEEIDIRKEEILNELKDVIPSSFTRFNKERGYSREPKEVQQAKANCLIEYYNKYNKYPTDKEVEEYVEKETGFSLREFVVGNKLTKQEEEFAKLGVVFTEKESRIEKRWVKQLEFNPNSPDQISDLIKLNEHEELARKLTVNIKKEYKDIDVEKKKGKDNVSTSKMLLKKLGEKTGNNAYKLIIEYKELGKMKGTYIDGYKPDLDGRIHTTYTMRPATMQTSSRNPNVQNSPQHSVLAQKFKETVEAPEGYVLLKFDYRSYHAKMLGFLAQDLDYIRLSSIDPHSYVAAHMAQLPEANECITWSDDKLKEFLTKVKKKYKSLRDDQAKHATLGIGFLLTEMGCYERYRDDFNPKQEEVLENWGRKKNNPLDINDKTGMTYLQQETEKIGKGRVKVLYNLLKKLFPKIFDWQSKIIVEADTKGFIQIPFGARRWFFAASEVRYDKFGNVSKIVKGEQAEDAVAFPVACNAFCHMREGLLIMQKKGLLDKYRLNNMVHDDLRFEVKKNQIQECIEEIIPIMERNSTILINDSMSNGFWCATDVVAGKNLLFDMEINL